MVNCLGLGHSSRGSKPDRGAPPPTPAGLTVLVICLPALWLSDRWSIAGDLQPGAGHAFDGAQGALLRRVAERYGHAARAGARRAADTVHVVLWLCRKIEV